MAVRKAHPMQTRTGKTRLGPLNLNQLIDLKNKTQKKKEKAKIQNRIQILERRLNG
jgi:hypothetical protein